MIVFSFNQDYPAKIVVSCDGEPPVKLQTQALVDAMNAPALNATIEEAAEALLEQRAGDE